MSGKVDPTADPHATLLGWTGLLSKARADTVLICQPNDSTVAHMGELSAETLEAQGRARLRRRRRLPRRRLHPEAGLSGLVPLPHAARHRRLLAAGQLRSADPDRRGDHPAGRSRARRPRRHGDPAAGRVPRRSSPRPRPRSAPRTWCARRSSKGSTRRRPISSTASSDLGIPMGALRPAVLELAGPQIRTRPRRSPQSRPASRGWRDPQRTARCSPARRLAACGRAPRAPSAGRRG